MYSFSNKYPIDIPKKAPETRANPPESEYGIALTIRPSPAFGKKTIPTKNNNPEITIESIIFIGKFRSPIFLEI